MMTPLPMTRIVLYKHGVGYFEREGTVNDDAVLSLTFKQAEVSDVLKSLTILDHDGGHIAAVSYDSTKPMEQLLAEIALSIPDHGSLLGLVPQLKGARVEVAFDQADEPLVGAILGVDVAEVQGDHGIAKESLVSVLTDEGEMMSFSLFDGSLKLLDEGLKRDLEFYLRTQLSAKKKDARTFSLFAQGKGERRIQMSYVLEAPVWKATYRILLNETDQPPMIQGWAVVDNTQDEDWNNVQLSLIAGLPVSFVHDLYTPRFMKRPVVEVKETTGVLPPEVESGVIAASFAAAGEMMMDDSAEMAYRVSAGLHKALPQSARRLRQSGGPSSVQTQVRERQIGDLFEYEIERPVTIRRNQSALVPIVLKPFQGRSVLLYQKAARAENPMRCVEFENTTGLTLEGGPVTVLDEGNYVGEAMLDTTKPSEQRLVPYAVELAVRVMDSIDTHNEDVSRVVIRKGVLTAHYAQVQQTTYTFISKSEKEQTLFLDHPRNSKEWKLTSETKPHEITDNFWRFKVTLPAGKTTLVRVVEQQKLRTTHSISDADDNRVHLWLDQKFLDDATAAKLQEAIRWRKQAADLQHAINQLVAERDQIHVEQGRIRENLNALGDRPSEKELRERFVRTFNSQEDRLEQINAEVKRMTAEMNACNAQVSKALDKLEYEGSIA